MGVLGKNNINAFSAKTARQRQQIKTKAAVFIRQKALLVLKDAIKVSPQWSGNFAANWWVEVKGQQGAYTPKFKVNPWQSLQASKGVKGRMKQQGDPEALQYVMGLDPAEYLNNIQWNSVLRLVNYAPVADAIENREIPLRPVNTQVIGSQGVVAFLKTKYSFIR